MMTSRIKQSLGFRLFWLGFGLLLGVPQLLDGIKYNLNGELFFGIGMLLVGIRGFLRPPCMACCRWRWPARCSPAWPSSSALDDETRLIKRRSR